MTSSSIFRNSQLTHLDNRFDRLLDKEYASEEEQDEETELDNMIVPGATLTGNELERLFDDFLEKTDIKGKRMIEKLTPLTQIDSIRMELKDSIPDIKEYEVEYDSEDDKDIYIPIEKQKEEWDCESILSTYSNIYNHPRTIKEASKKAIRVDKDGMALTAKAAFKEMKQEKLFGKAADISEESESEVNRGVPRNKEETLEEKKERKNLIKMERRTRREQKKTTTTAFKQETKKQIKQQKSLSVSKVLG